MRARLRKYNTLINKEVKVMNVPYKPAVRVEKYIAPQSAALTGALAAVTQALNYYERHKKAKKRDYAIATLKKIEVLLREDYKEVKLDLTALESQMGLG